MTSTSPNKGGRPKGYSPGLRRIITHKIGAWTWNTETLHKRIVKDAEDPYACWTWMGSKNQHGNIFGAFKNDKPQMTQANRLLAMEQLNRPVDDISIHMRCGNHHCSNPQHFEFKPNNRYKP